MNSEDGSGNYFSNSGEGSDNYNSNFGEDSGFYYPNFEQDLSNYYPNFEQDPGNYFPNSTEDSSNHYPYFEQGSDNYYSINLDAYAMFNEIEGYKAQEEFQKKIEEYRQFTLRARDEAPMRGGSRPGREYKPRMREEKHEALMRNYFVERPVYNDEDFRMSFRMKKSLFLRLVEACERENGYFQQKRDRAGRLGFTPLMKVTIALRMLAYAYPADSMDEAYHIGESTTCENLRQFCKTILRLYKTTYLRQPNVDDLKRILDRAERRGFPGMIGSLDCMHWEWKNCPTGWQGAFSGKTKKPTIILETVVDADTWIWHAFFGVPKSQNDIIALGRSPLFDSLATENCPKVKFQVNNRDYFMGYYLADIMYPKCATLVQTFRNPIDHKQKLFTQMQESYQKDVERAFGILQARFTIIKQPGRGWNIEDLSDIMLTCIVLHNMIVEDERDEYADEDSGDDETDLRKSRRARAKIYPQSEKKKSTTVDLDTTRSGNFNLEEYMRRRASIRSEDANDQLRKDLVEHVWTTHGPFSA